jgi:beta-galactosidase
LIPESFNHGWGIRPKTSPFFELMSPIPFTPVTLPHDAMISRERRSDAPSGAMNGFFPGGDEEYQKEIVVPREWSERRVFLAFQGVYRDARVYVNGALAGHHAYGYAGFVVQLDPYLRYGAVNAIRVECTANDDTRWYSGQGIYRPVELYVGGLVHAGVETLRITTLELDDYGATVEVAETIENESSVTHTLTVVSEFVDANDVVVAKDSVPITIFAGTAERTRRRLFLDQVRRWDPDDPYRYFARVTIWLDNEVLDRTEAKFGVRSLQLDPKNGLRINGERVKLRGACLHHDNGPLGAATFGRADERRVELLKGAGFNALRSAHNPMSRAMLEACDRLGVLVMDEAFDVWYLNKARFDYSRDFDTWWEADIEAMVRKDYNHPSVIMYSIGNEIQETGNSLAAPWGRRLTRALRDLDPHRYTVNCINGLLSVVNELGKQVADGATITDNFGVNDMLAAMVEFSAQITASDLVSDRTEEALGQVDITGYNYGDSRYELDTQRFPNRVAVGSETSRTAIAHNWELVSKLPHVIGDFCWTGWDYLGEAGVGRFDSGDGDAATAGVTGPFPYLSAAAGDIDITGTRLPVSFYRETVFGLRDCPYLAVHRPIRFDNPGQPTAWSWTDALGSWSWDGDEGRPIRVHVYSDADEIELLIGENSVGVVPVGIERPFVASFETVFEPGTVTAIARTAELETGRTELVSATGPISLGISSDVDRLELGDDALVFVRVSLVDAFGTLNPSQRRKIRVEVDGPGVLQAIGSGDPKPDEPLNEPERSTFNGTLLAVIRPVDSGTITVTAYAEDCGSAATKITVH